MKGLAGALASCAAVIVAAPAAAASQDGEPVTIEYRAPAGCPDAREFVWRVSARVPRVRAAKPGEHPRAFVADIELNAQGATGVLTIRETDGRESTRRFDAQSCADAADALALIVALAIDPRAATDKLGPPPPTPEQPLTPPKPLPPVERPFQEPPVWRSEGGIDAFVATGFAPAWLPGAASTLGLRSEADQLVAPVVRLGLGYVAERSFLVSGGRVSFGWVGGQLEACPMQLHLASALRMLVCARGEIGSLRAHGAETTNPRSSARLWGAGGAATLLRFRLADPLHLQLSGSLMLPWDRDRFLIGANVVHEIPGVVGRLGIGLVIRLL